MTDRYELLKSGITPLIRVIGVAAMLYKAQRSLRRRAHDRVNAEALSRVVEQTAEVAALGRPGFWVDARWDRHALSWSFRGAVGNAPAP